jgi:hypothetical protein
MRCESGHRRDETMLKCLSCDAGFFSKGLVAESCTACLPGMSTLHRAPCSSAAWSTELLLFAPRWAGLFGMRMQGTSKIGMGRANASAAIFSGPFTRTRPGRPRVFPATAAPRATSTARSAQTKVGANARRGLIISSKWLVTVANGPHALFSAGGILPQQRL